MSEKAKNFGNKVANFGKKFIGGLLFDDLPEASAVSKADRLEYPFHDTQDYKSCIQFGIIDEEPVDLGALIGFGSIFGKNETVEGEENGEEGGQEWRRRTAAGRVHTDDGGAEAKAGRVVVWGSAADGIPEAAVQDRG